jgi:TonB family protein
MKKMYLIISLFVFSILAKAQTKEIEYYKDLYCSKKTNAEKGKFQLTTLHYADGSVETIKQKINDNKIIEHFKNDEPIGIWMDGQRELNFDFDIEYTEAGCIDTLTGINSTELFTDHTSVNYIAPKIASGQKDLFDFLISEVIYPTKALNEGLSGKCLVFFSVDEQGNITKVLAQKGGLAIFDKEVIRMIRKLKISTPAMLDGIPKSICVKLPYNFVMN